MAITQIRNEQIKDLTIELNKIKLGSELIKRDGSIGFTGDVNANAHRIINVTDPINAQDAATKAYVDATAQGLFPKEAVRVISLSNINLESAGLLTIDGVTLVTGDRVLVAAQTDATQNGIYVVSDVAWTRSIDADTSAKVKAGLFTFVTEGVVNQDSGWVLVTDNPIVLNTTGLLFTRFSGAGQIDAGKGMTKNGNTLDVQTADTTRIVVNADSIDLARVGIASTYNVVTTDAYGRVESAFLRTLVAGTSGLSIANGDGTSANPSISLDSDLVSLANLNANGIITRTGEGSSVIRSIEGTSAQITVINGDAVNANPVISLTDFGTVGTYNIITTDSKGRVESAFLRTLTSVNTDALTITNGDGVAGNPSISLDADLVAVANISTSGLTTRTAANTWTTRMIEVGSGLIILNADGVAGNPTISMAGSLSSMSSLTTTGLIVQTASGIVSTRAMTSNTVALTITNADGVAGNPIFDLDADLTSIANISTTGFGVRSANNNWTTRAIEGTVGTIVITNGDAVNTNPVITLDTVNDDATGTFLKFTRDSFGRVSGTTAVTTADITALVNATYVNVTGDSLTGFLTLHADPEQPTHAVTKQYVDAVATGLDQKQSVRAATVSEITLAGEQIVDGVAVVAGNRVLVKNQTNAVDNGIYIVSTGAWLRSADADNSPGSEITSGLYTFVEEGIVNGDNGWTLITNDPIAIGVTNLEFSQFSGAGQIIAGDGLTKAGNRLDVISADASRIVVNPDSIDLATTGVVAGDYNVVKTDIYGRVQSAYLRSLTSANTGALTITNGTGVAGDPTIIVDADLVSLADISSTGFGVRTAADTWTTRSVESATVALTVTNGDAVAGNVSLDLDADLKSLAAITTTGFGVRAANDTWVTRSITTSSTALSVANGDAVAGNVSLSLDADLDSIAAISTTGFGVRSAANTWTTRAITVGSGLTITDGDAVATNPLITLNGSLASLSSLTGTGFVVQDTSNTIVARSIISNNSLLSVSNGDAVAANPTLDIELASGWVIRGNSSNKGQAYREVIAEVANSINFQNYTLVHSPVSGTEQVFLNGVLQRVGMSYDYELVEGQVVFNAVNSSADVVQVTYYSAT